MVYSTPKHVGGMWQIYCYMNIYMHIVGIFEEISYNNHIITSRSLKVRYKDPSQIYCYMNIYVHIVGIIKEISYSNHIITSRSLKVRYKDPSQIKTTNTTQKNAHQTPHKH